MRLIYLFLSIGLIGVYAAILNRVRKSSSGLTPILGWIGGLGIFLIIPLVIMTLSGRYALSSRWDVGFDWGSIDLTDSRFLFPYLMVWTSLTLSFLAIYLFLPLCAPTSRRGCVLSRRAITRILLITMGIAVVDWALLIHMVGGFETFLASHWYNRMEDLVGRYGDSFVLIEHLDAANAILFTSAAALYTGEGLKNRDTCWKLTSMIVAFLVLETIITGNRIFLATYLLAFVISTWLFKRRRAFVIFLAFCPVLVLALSAWASIRHNLSAVQSSVDVYWEEGSRNRVTDSAMDVTEGVDTLLLMHVIDDFGSRHDYLYGLSYSRAVTSLIPRSLYPQKPEPFASFLARIYVRNQLTSLNATALGEMYANFGPATLFLFPLFSLGVVFLNGWAVRRDGKRGLIRVVLFILMVWVARSTFEDNFISFLLIVVFVAIFHFERGLYLYLPSEPLQAKLPNLNQAATAHSEN
jgi:hypothetical protein